jgi:hypothetical protein
VVMVVMMVMMVPVRYGGVLYKGVHVARSDRGNHNSVREGVRYITVEMRNEEKREETMIKKPPFTDLSRNPH